MPIREYECQKCKHVFENLELRATDKAEVCPQCFGKRLKQVVSAFGGYQGNLGGASTRPKNAGSFKRGRG